MALPKKQRSKSRRKLILPKTSRKYKAVYVLTRDVHKLKAGQMGNHDVGTFFSIKKRYLRSEKEETVPEIKKKSRLGVTTGLLGSKKLTLNILPRARGSLPKPPLFLKKTPNNMRIFRKINHKRARYIRRLVTQCKLRVLVVYYPDRRRALKGLWRKKVRLPHVGTVIRRPLHKLQINLGPFWALPPRDFQQRPQLIENPLTYYNSYTPADGPNVTE